MSDDDMRRAYLAHLNARGIDERDAGPNGDAARPDCPVPEVLAQLAQGEGATALGAFDHVLQCQYCLPEFELLRTLARAERDAQHVENGEAPPMLRSHQVPSVARQTPGRAARSWGAAGWAMAATVLVAVALGGTWWQRRAGRDALPAEEESTVIRNGDSAVVIVTPRGTVAVAEGPRAFVWRAEGGSAVGGADVVYVVEAFDSLGVLLLSRTVRDTALVLSDAEGAALRRAETFDWMVRAERGDGNERRSPLVRVRLGSPTGSPAP